MRSATTRTLVLMLLAASLLPCLDQGVFAKAAKKNDPWQSRENLVNRLGAELNKIDGMNRELADMGDVLANIGDLEFFPPELTGLDKAGLVRFDKKIERLEKDQAALSASLDGLRPPLLDGMAILREMVVKEPVESMFDVLEQGDRTRTAEVLRIKQGADTLWAAADSLLTAAARGAGIAPAAAKVKSGSDEDSFAARSAGRRSEPYFWKLRALLDSIVGKGSAANVNEMFAIETGRIKKYVKEGAIPLARQKIAEVAARYAGKTGLGEITLLAARTAIMQGDYQKALTTLAQVAAAPASAEAGERSALSYRLQSLYALARYDSLWAEAEHLNFPQIGGPARNFLLWITMESGLALKKKNVYVRLASLSDRKSPYALHIMHALGRSYLAAGDPSTALSVFESAAKFSARSDADKTALQALRYAIAETNYELGRYQQALALFYELLNDPGEFERGLYGALWCYIELGMDDKVDGTVRKLINQAPESRFAADALIVLAQRYLNAAHDEWKKTQYLTSEEQRLRDMVERIDAKQKADTSRTRAQPFAAARKELVELLSQLRAQPRCAQGEIDAYYTKIAHVGALLTSSYGTGSYQRAPLTEKRESLLRYLDSCILTAKAHSDGSRAVARSGSSPSEVAAVKSIVAQSSVFMTEAMIEQYRFEQEYCNWQKSQLNDAEQAALRPLLQRSDSVSRAALAARKKTTAHLLDSLLVAEERMRQQWNDRLTARLQLLIAQGVDSANAAYFHYHLGELLYGQENARYSRDYEKYEKTKASFAEKMAAYRDGTLSELPEGSEPKPPRTDHTASMEHFRAVLALAPASPAAGSAHYCLAWCWNDLAAFDSALAQMEVVANKFPQSQYAPQAWMYAGEYMFDKGNLARAIACYQAVMKYPESDWFDEALYKMAWAQYRLSNPEKAISSFLALVDLGGGRKKGKALLEKESMDYIAISFSEADMTGEKGLQRAVTFATKLGDPDRGSEILHRLAKVYMDQGRYDMAKKTYRTLLKMNPTYRNLPVVESELVAAVEREATPEEANQLKAEFFKKYNRKSEWAQMQADAEAVGKADSLAQERLYDAAIGYHQMALQKSDTAAYGRAAAVYTDFIRAYPKSARTSECHYNLAEIEFSLGDYNNAAQDYIAVSKRYPDSKFRETAAWNAIVASQNLLKKEGAIR